MRVSPLFWGLVVIWAAAFAMSFWALFGMEPTGDGFTRGLNRLTAFVGWQLLAAMVALCLWLVGRRIQNASGLRWLSRVPGLLAILLVLAVAALILYARLSKPDPAPPPQMTPTAPAMKLDQ
ncbi:hypothetical protein LCL97_09145 [Seohaeicola saemankumensis]|nr:hypothetical protein [Seohaeicola saemankumensis]MCA0870990.1 hypothetical protein [Seohaeicola saemankumensis]